MIFFKRLSEVESCTAPHVKHLRGKTTGVEKSFRTPLKFFVCVSKDLAAPETHKQREIIFVIYLFYFIYLVVLEL